VRSFVAESARQSEEMEETQARLAKLEEQTAALTCWLVDQDRRRATVEPIQTLVQPPISTSTRARRGAAARHRRRPA